MSNEWVEAFTAEVKKMLVKGKVIIRTSNETFHLDAETGEVVSDSFTSETIEINPPDVKGIGGGGKVG
jgi:hypothetical protein